MVVISESSHERKVVVSLDKGQAGLVNISINT
jgi:hypothetical protein